MEHAINHHADNNIKWWKDNESVLEDSAEAGFIYFLVQIYIQSPQKHLESIHELLANDELLRESELRYELAF